MGSRPDALTAAIDAAWRVFDMPAPATTGVCQHCCMEPEIEADFLKRTARDLPAHYVRDWYEGAYDASIQHDHVAWFLPRVMEMLAAGDEVTQIGNEVAFARLPLTGFPDRWPEGEVRAVRDFAQAYFNALIHSDLPRTAHDIDTALCMFGKARLDLAPFLTLLDRLPDAKLVENLKRLWVWNGKGRVWFTAFWDREPERAVAWNWYTSEALRDRMELAGHAGHDGAYAVHDAILRARSEIAP